MLAIAISTAVTFIPILNRVLFLNGLLSQQLVLLVLFMCRDYFFCGRGIGKNLMGLQVVSRESEMPISIRQSLLRNLTLTAPILLLELTSRMPSSLMPVVVRDIFNIVEAVYAIIVLPLESYRAYSREDSLRLGDVLAYTQLVVSQSSFDNFLSKQKN